MPQTVLSSAITILMRNMSLRHPRLFQNLARLDRAVLHVEPTDAQHRFALTFGHGPTTLALIDDMASKPDACIKGSLECLLNLLEGRIDSDMLFFTRDIQITGDTSIIVGLRNTLDREDINLMDDVTSFFGPFAAPLQKAVVLLDGVMLRVRKRFAPAPETTTQSGPDEREALRAEIQDLKKQLAKAKVRNKRAEAAA
jgi:predicted lipid carrier protein YhbT